MANLTSLSLDGTLSTKGGTESGSKSAALTTAIQGASSRYNSTTTTNWTAGVYTTNGKSVIAYQDEAGGYYGKPKAVVATLNGSSISYGGVQTVDTSNDADNGIAIGYEQTENKVLICYGTNNNHQHTMIVGTVSGTSISFGSAVALESGSTPDDGSFGCQSMFWVGGIGGDTTNRLVCCYNDQNNNGTARVMTISGTTPSGGTSSEFQVNQPGNHKARCISCAYVGNGQIVVTWLDHGDSNKLYIRPGTVTGGGTNTIQWGTQSISFGVCYLPDTSGTGTSIAYDQQNQKILVFYALNADKEARWVGGQLTGSGASLAFTFSGSGTFDSAANARAFTSTYHPDAQKVIAYYRTDAASGQPHAKVFTYDQNYGSQVAYNIGSAVTWYLGPNVDHTHSLWDPQNKRILYLKTNIRKHNNTAEAAGYAIVSDLFTTNITINLSTGNFFEIDLQDHSADIHSITINEAITGTQTQKFYMKLIQGSYGRLFNWSAITNIKWPGASGPVMTAPDNTVDILSFTTYDQGTTWYGETVGRNFS